MRLTGETITDEQIRELQREGRSMLSRSVLSGLDSTPAYDVLLCTSNALGASLDVSDANGEFTYWRARCAEILNARNGATS